MAPKRELPAPPHSSPRKTSGASTVRKTSDTSTIRKASSNSNPIQIPNPLRVFKRNSRKPSLDSILRHPSLQSLKVQPSLTDITEPPSTTAAQPSYGSLDCHVSHSDFPANGGTGTLRNRGLTVDRNSKPSFETIRRHPSLQSLKLQPYLSSFTEADQNVVSSYHDSLHDRTIEPTWSSRWHSGHPRILRGTPPRPLQPRVSNFWEPLGEDVQGEGDFGYHEFLDDGQPMTPIPPLLHRQASPNPSISRDTDPHVGGNSSIALLPSPPANDDGKTKDPDVETEWDFNQGHFDLEHGASCLRAESSNPGVVTGKVSTSASSCCSLCKTTLTSALKTYAFPRTAPAIISAVRELHPALDATIDNLFGSSSGELKEGVTTFQARAPPIFCLTCFEELHKLHICWTCGLTVVREEERVGCGWAWWHWGCVSCLLCRAPVRPPAWTSAPITLSDSPACKACLRELRELVFLERRKMHMSRRPLSPPLTPDLIHGVGVDVINRSTGHRIYHPKTNLVAIDHAASSVVDISERESRALRNLKKVSGNWRDVGGYAKGSGNGRGRIGDGSVGGGVRGARGVGVRYPPLPKWMEKLPGRRSASGVRTANGVDKI